jgi:hypothetical protein
MSSNLSNIAAYILRSATVAVLLTAVTLGAVFASQPAFAEEKSKTPVVTKQVTDITSGIQRSKTLSSDRNAEAVRALL